MAKKFISINDAAELANKSVQTIRRAIKSTKLKTKKVRTPQGFHYLVNRDSLVELYALKIEEQEVAKTETKTETKFENKTTQSTELAEEGGINVSAKDFREFTKTLQTMVSQHSEERQNFMRLINTLQEKVFVMENQLSLLKAPQKKWYNIWK